MAKIPRGERCSDDRRCPAWCDRRPMAASVPIGVHSLHPGWASRTVYIAGLPSKSGPKGMIVGTLNGKVAVITGGSIGMALTGAKMFVEEGAHVFIQARRQEAL